MARCKYALGSIKKIFESSKSQPKNFFEKRRLYNATKGSCFSKVKQAFNQWISYYFPRSKKLAHEEIPLVLMHVPSMDDSRRSLFRDEGNQGSEVGEQSLETTIDMTPDDIMRMLEDHF